MGLEVEWIQRAWAKNHALEIRHLAELRPEQRETLLVLDRQWGLKRQSLRTRQYKLGTLRRFLKAIGKPMQQASKADIESYIVKELERRKPASVEGDKRVLKATYKELLAPDEPGHPDVVRWIKLANPFRETKAPEELLTPEETMRLAQASGGPRNRALILLMSESGARVSEVAALRVGDVKFDEYGAVVVIGGDTDTRTARLIYSAADVARWLDQHPRRDDPNGPLWTANRRPDGHAHLGPEGMRDMLRKAAERAGISKRVHPHLLRHTELNKWLDDYNDDVVKFRAGWSKNSQMVQVYRHRSGKRYDQIILEKEGLLRKEDVKAAQPLRPKKCTRCSKVAGVADKYCLTCGFVLDEKEARALSDERDQLSRQMAKLATILENPRIKELLSAETLRPPPQEEADENER